MVKSDEARDGCLIARSRERTGATIASKETCSIESIDLRDRSAWCSRERTITTLTGDEDRQRMQKGTQQSTRLWLLSCFFSLWWSAWIPALTTNKRVHRVWTNSTINQIGFFLQPEMPVVARNNTVDGAMSHHRKSTIHLWRMSPGYTVVVVVALHELFLYLCKWYLQRTLDLQCLIAFKHWQIK
jgi:hypothetical protein